MVVDDNAQLVAVPIFDSRPIGSQFSRYTSSGFFGSEQKFRNATDTYLKSRRIRSESKEGWPPSQIRVPGAERLDSSWRTNSGECDHDRRLAPIKRHPMRRTRLLRSPTSRPPYDYRVRTAQIWSAKDSTVEDDGSTAAKVTILGVRVRAYQWLLTTRNTSTRAVYASDRARVTMPVISVVSGDQHHVQRLEKVKSE